MNTITLSLRERKLLNYLNTRNAYVTGEALSKELHVTARTVRNDVQDINESLAGTGISVFSKHGLGYCLKVENRKLFEEINRAGSSFLARSGRVRHIAFLLAESEKPVSLYDLEDQMFVSRTALEQDLQALRRTWILPLNLTLNRRRNAVLLEKDERKRRNLLCRLLSENWNYNGRGDLYYKYPILEKDTLDLITDETVSCISAFGIRIEDINLVLLELMIAVAVFRMQAGYFLTLTDDVRNMLMGTLDPYAVKASDELLDTLEEKLSCRFPAAERLDIYHRLSISRLTNPDELNFENVLQQYPKNIFTLANAYLQRVRFYFGLDLLANESFYIILIQYLYYLSKPEHALNPFQESVEKPQDDLIDLEIAYVIQPLALSFYGNYLNRDELLYLASALSGARSSIFRNSEKKHAVLLSHLNIPAAWNLKQSVLNRFSAYLSIDEMLPMYEKNAEHLRDYDLVISTTNKPFSLPDGHRLVQISPLFTLSDEARLKEALEQFQTDTLYRTSLPSLERLLERAFWHENMGETEYLGLLETLAGDFTEGKITGPEFLQDLLRRESMMSFAVRPGVILSYALCPAERTCLSIGILTHRIRRNGHKIRAVIMAAIRPEEYPLVFKLINEIYYKHPNGSESAFLRSKQELTDWLVGQN